jgi:hypothetical protein
MTSRVEYCLEKAVECDREAMRASDDKLKAMYFDLAKQWRDMAHQAEELERLPRNAKLQ